MTPMSPRQGNMLLSAGAILAATVLAGRLAGFLREMQIGAMFGLSREGDFAVIVLTLPDLLTNLLLAGGLSAVLVPEFQAVGESRRRSLLLRVLVLVGLVFAALALVVALFPRAPVALLAPAYAGAVPQAMSLAMQVAALAIPLAGLAGVTGAFLNARKRFFLAGAGTLVFNLAIIVALLAFATATDLLLVLACAVVAGALLRLASQLIASWRASTHDGVAEIARVDALDLVARFGKALTASTLVLLVPVLLRAAISTSGEGHIAAFNFATKLVELPTAIAISSLVAVLLPQLSELAIGDDRRALVASYAHGQRAVLCVSLAIALPAIWFAEPIATVAFGYGRMTPADLDLIATLARIGFVSLPFVAIAAAATALLSARRLISSLLNSTLLALLVLPLAALPGILAGDARLVMLALPLFQAVLALLLARAARRELPKMALLDAGFVRFVLACCAITLVLGLIGMALPFRSAYIGVAFAVIAMGLSVLLLKPRQLFARRSDR